MEDSDPFKPHRELLQKMHACIMVNLISSSFRLDNFRWPCSPYPAPDALDSSMAPGVGETDDQLHEM